MTSEGIKKRTEQSCLEPRGRGGVSPEGQSSVGLMDSDCRYGNKHRQVIKPNQNGKATQYSAMEPDTNLQFLQKIPPQGASMQSDALPRPRLTPTQVAATSMSELGDNAVALPQKELIKSSNDFTHCG